MHKLRLEVINIHQQQKLKQLAGMDNCYQIKSVKEIGFFKIESSNPIQPTNQLLEVFYDHIIQEIHASDYQIPTNYNMIIEIGLRPGVTDNLGNTSVEALKLIGITAKVSTGKLYFVETTSTIHELRKFAFEKLGNDLIETISIHSLDDFLGLKRFKNISLPTVKLDHGIQIHEINLNVSSVELSKLSQERCLALTLKELNCIRDYFNQDEIKNHRKQVGLPTNPTDVEIEVIAQTWSEHCKHKIFSAKIEYYDHTTDDLASNFVLIDSLYKTYIKSLTKKIETKYKIDWLVSVFDDNAGIVRFDEMIDLCIKVETHNSPSALDPYGGAITGILGVNRDILGCGMGAKPIANTDVFCFCDPKWPSEKSYQELPLGLKHPSTILRGVHKGIEDGGNKSGIPTVNGAIYFDHSYAGKPLVFCGTVGVLPQTLIDQTPASKKMAKVGDRIIMIGGFIGADGIHGATMSSLELNESSPATAVQIGDPLTQKRVLDFLIVARNRQLFNAITDNGAGGLSSSVGEMANQTGGATLDLALCPVKYPGLSPYELFISESQERMTLSVPPEHLSAITQLANLYGVTLTDIGEFNDSKYLTVYYKHELVGKIDLDFLHHGLPQLSLIARWDGEKLNPSWFSKNDKKLFTGLDRDHLKDSLRRLLHRNNIASKQSLVKRYDHEVMASTHIKPFMGPTQSGPSDSGVIWLHPHGGSKDNGVAISCGLNPRLSQHDPYLMAQLSVDEAIRNIVATGGDPEMTCLLDNFCWPDPVASLKNPDGEHKLAQLVKTCMGLYDICLSYKTPLVSGKDSMKNDFRGKNTKGEEVIISILPTLLITAMSKVNVNHTCTMGFKQTGDLIYLIGKPSSGLLGSEYLEEYNYKNKQHLHLPSIDIDYNHLLYKTLHQAIKMDMLSSCHDLSDGGLLISLVESTFENHLGADINLSSPTTSDLIDYFYNEGPGRFVITVPVHKQEYIEKHLSSFNLMHLGYVSAHPTFKLNINNDNFLNESVESLMSIWKKEF